MAVKQQQTMHPNLVRFWETMFKIPLKQHQTEFNKSFVLYKLEPEK